jgi:hypothetical protein
MATSTRLSDPMIRAMLAALAYQGSDGRYQSLTRGSTRTALTARGMVEMEETRDGSGRPVGHFYLTPKSLTTLRNGFVIMMGTPGSKATEWHRAAIRSNAGISRAAAALILGNIAGARVITRTLGSAPTTEDMTAEQAIVMLSLLLTKGQRIEGYGTGPQGDEPPARLIAHTGDGFPREYEFILTHWGPAEETTVEEPTPVTVEDVEEVDYRMFVGVLFEDAGDMGIHKAANVREAIKNNAEQGHRAVRTEDGMIHVYYSWFVPQRVAVEEDDETPARYVVPVGKDTRDWMRFAHRARALSCAREYGLPSTAVIDTQAEAVILDREPWRGGQHCGHQITVGRMSSEYCGARKASGLALCLPHHDEVAEEYGTVRMAPGNALGDPSIPLTLMWEGEDGEPIAPYAEEATQDAYAWAVGEELGTEELLAMIREQAAVKPTDDPFARAVRALDEILTAGGIECLPAAWDGYADGRAQG